MSAIKGELDEARYLGFAREVESRRGICEIGAGVLAGASLATAVVGAGVSAYSSEQQAGYQKAVAQNNASVASLNATYAVQAGNQQLQAKQIQTAQLLGKERATAGAGNVELSSGSPLKIQSDTATLGSLDALTIQNNAARQAWNYQEQAAGFNAQAVQAGSAGNLNAFSSLIGAASSVSGKWSQYQNSGIYSGDASQVTNPGFVTSMNGP